MMIPKLMKPRFFIVGLAFASPQVGVSCEKFQTEQNRHHAATQRHLHPYKVHRPAPARLPKSQPGDHPYFELHSTQQAVSQARAHFQIASKVAAANVLINLLRPDSFIPMPLRLPRFCWEAGILILSLWGASDTPPSSSLSLLLTIVTFPTALTDLFVWAPLFSFLSLFDGHFNENSGRMWVALQCMVGGMIYLKTSVMAFQSFLAQQNEDKLERHRYMKMVDREIEDSTNKAFAMDQTPT